MEKQLYDVRGRQSSILRLWRFDREAFVHMVSNRILMFFALLTAAILIWNIHSPNYVTAFWGKIAVLIVWALFTPQLFAAFKAFSRVSSRGGAFGRFTEAYARTNVKSGRINPIYRALPYAAVTVWLLGLVASVLVWF